MTILETNKYVAENAYRQYLQNTINQNATGEIEIQLSVAPVSEFGWVIIEPDSTGNREEVFYHRKAGTSIFTYDVNRANAKAHMDGSLVVLNNSAGIYNFKEKLNENIFYHYKTSDTNLYIFGGIITDIDGNKFTIDNFNTSTLSLVNNSINYIYIGTEDSGVTYEPLVTQTLSDDIFIIKEITKDAVGVITLVNEGRQSYKSISTGLSGYTGFDIRYYTETEIDTLLNNKVDKVYGKGLSTEDYSTIEKTKLSGIESGAEVNITENVLPGAGITIDRTGKDITITSTAIGGTTDHGLLTGLSDDDHSQYHNDTRGDIRYYTKAQVDSSLSGKANTSHTHTASNITDFQSNVSSNTNVSANTAARHTHTNSTILNQISNNPVETITAGTNITVNRTGNSVTINSTGTGGGATTLDDLTDVTITTPATGQALTYNGTQWINSTPAGSGDMLKTENLSGLTNYSTARTNLGLNTTVNQTDSTDKRFMTDAQESKLDAITGTNTGDNAPNTNTGLVHTTGAETIGGVKTFSDNLIATDNVGIGTTNPGAKLDVAGNIISNTTGTGVIYVKGTTNAEIRLNENETNEWSIKAENGNSFRIQKYDGSGNWQGNFLSIDSATGNVGIGTTSPSAKLDVNGTILQNGQTVGEPDFYKYNIVTSVASGNLTVALKNYLGQDPSATVPVKVQIGDTIRTITSALNYTRTAGSNWLNMGNLELATKEVDLFTYLFYSGGNIGIAISRIPYANIKEDFIYSDTNEKGLLISFDADNGSKFINIGRFNTILSAGPGHTFSLPATSVIINRPIYSTRWLDCIATLSGATGSAGSYAESDASAKYKISENTINFMFGKKVTNIGSWSGDSLLKTPFGGSNLSNLILGSGGIMNGNNGTFKTIISSYGNSCEYLNFANNLGVNWGQYSVITVNDFIMGNVTYQI